MDRTLSTTRARSQSPNDKTTTSAVGRATSPPRAHSTLPFYGDRSKEASPYNAASLRRRLPRSDAVDYSYRSLTNLAEVVGSVPRSGTVFVRRASPSASPADQSLQPGGANLGDAIKQQQNKASQDSMLFQFGDKKGQQGKTTVTDDGVVVIKAKDENYAFKEIDQAVYVSDKDMKNWVMDANGNLVRRKLTAKEEQELLESKRTLYRCTILRMNNNELSDLTGIDRSLYLTLFKPMEFLTVVDLSCNRIVAIPDRFCERYPIHTLLLHGNAIQSIDQLQGLRSLAGTLRSLTLYDNPVQHTYNRKYRMMVLCTLPFITTLDGVFITDADRAKLPTFVDMFIPRKHRDGILKTIGTITNTASTALPPIGRGGR